MATPVCRIRRLGYPEALNSWNSSDCATGGRRADGSGPFAAYLVEGTIIILKTGLLSRQIPIKRRRAHLLVYCVRSVKKKRKRKQMHAAWTSILLLPIVAILVNNPF